MACFGKKKSGNPGNSFDLREFVDMMSEYADIRLLVLNRGLAAASWSHREWDGGLVQHARVLALFAEYLTRVLGDLDTAIWRWVAYEDLCAAHESNDPHALNAMAMFLGLPEALLRRAFAEFTPSKKDASAEMPRCMLRAIQALELRHGPSWFTSKFPNSRLLVGPVKWSVPKGCMPVPGRGNEVIRSTGSQCAKESGPDRRVREAPIASGGYAGNGLSSKADTCEPGCANSTDDPPSSQENDEAMRILREAILQAKTDVDPSVAGDPELEKATKVNQLLKGLMLDRDTIDPKNYSCVHFWLEGRGFGSEINNLISAAVYCREFGIDLIVEDEKWNSGRVHDYFEAYPFIQQTCRNNPCREMKIHRDKGVATSGWFAVQRHAKNVSLEQKSELARRIMRFTPETAAEVHAMNFELGLREGEYVAVQIRRGDKTTGARRESVPVPMASYVTAAIDALQSRGLLSTSGRSNGRPVVAVCSDDLSAAEEFNEELDSRGDIHSRIQVVYRRRAKRPWGREGHWQADFNSQPLETRKFLTLEFLADVEVLRQAAVCVVTFSSNVGRLVALLRDGPIVSLDGQWKNE